MKKLMLYAVMLVLGMTFLGAQAISDYTYSTLTTGSLIDMSTGTTNLLTVAYHDDDASVVTNIGFNFTFGANVYTQFSVNSNGQMQLGATAISGTSASPSLNLARIAPISGDNSVQAAGKLHYKVIGTSPNQILVVEWNTLRIPYSSTVPGTFCTMQALLYQTSNKIEFIYGSMYNMGTSASTRGVYISTSNVVGSVGNVKTITATPTWDVAGTSVITTSFPASSAMANLNSSADGSRRVFVFNPPVATLPPNPAVVVSPGNGATLVLPAATLNWSSGGGMPTGYKLYFGTTATPPYIGDLGNVTTYDPNPDLVLGTTYYWQVVPYNTNGDATGCPIWSFQTLGEGYVSIGTGTATQAQPFDIYYGYCRSVSLYNATQIGTVGLLDEVAWYCGTSNASAVPYKIYAKTTTDAGLTAVTWDAFVATATLLETGNYTFSSTGWHSFVLDTPFIYTGGNLVIAVETYYGGGGVSPYPLFNYSTGAASTHLYWRQDTTPPTGVGTLNTQQPNVLLHLSPLGVDPELAINPESWDFGNTVINTLNTKQFNLTNIGGGTLSISNISISGEYFTLSVNPAPVSLDGAESTILTVQYAPTDAGTHNGTVTITDGRLVTQIPLTAVCYDPTIYDFPYTTNMETWPPLGWDPTPGTYDFTQYTDATPNNWARANYWSQSAGATDILVSPPLHPVDDSWVKFTWSHQYNATYPTDALTLQISSDMNTWVDLWSLAGTAFESADGAGTMVPGTGVQATVAIPVSYTGTTYWLRFYGYSGYGPDLFLDNVIVEGVPTGAPDHVTLTAPADGATGMDPFNLNLQWAAALTGAPATVYQIFVGADPIDPGIDYYGEYYYESATTSFDLDAQPDIELGYNTTWYWAVLPWNADGTPDPNDPAFMIWDFTTFADPSITSLPHSQNYDSVTAPALPNGWTKLIASTSSPTITTTTSTPNTIPNNVQFYNNADAAATLIMATPHITLGLQNIKLSFWARWYNYTSNIIVGTMTDPANAATFTQFASITPTSTNALYTVSFATYTGTDEYIAFRMTSASTYAYIYLDTVSMEQLMANDLAATAITGPGIGIANTPLTFNITVYNNGTAEQPGYNIHLKQFGGTRVQTATVFTPIAVGASVTSPITWTPLTGGTYNLVGEVELGGDGNAANNETSVMPVVVYSETAFIPQIGDINSATTLNATPFNFYWKNSLSETIYLSQEMQVTSGTIQAVVYQNNFTQDLTKPVKIWMKNTTETNVLAAWLPFTDYVLVFDGNVHFPLGVNAITIPLTTPFVYTGGNLAVRDYRVWEDVYWLSSNVFYYTADDANPNRCRYFYEDTVGGGFDPTAPVGVGTVANIIANTAFIIDPATPIAALDAPVVQTEAVGGNTIVSWPLVDGAYSYRVYESDDPYTWGSTPVATIHNNSITFPSAAKKFYKVVAITTYRNVDLGIVLNPATAIGFDNSNVKAEPAVGKTDKK